MKKKYIKPLLYCKRLGVLSMLAGTPGYSKRNVTFTYSTSSGLFDDASGTTVYSSNTGVTTWGHGGF